MKLSDRYLIFNEQFLYGDLSYPIISNIFISSLFDIQVDLSNYIKKTVPKNAHDVILHFIRSRPPLKPVSLSNEISKKDLGGHNADCY